MQPRNGQCGRGVGTGTRPGVLEGPVTTSQFRYPGPWLWRPFLVVGLYLLFHFSRSAEFRLWISLWPEFMRAVSLMYEACGFVPDGLRVAEAQLRRSTTLGAAAENMTKLEATAFLRKVVESRQRVVSHRVKVL